MCIYIYRHVLGDAGFLTSTASRWPSSWGRWGAQCGRAEDRPWAEGPKAPGCGPPVPKKDHIYQYGMYTIIYGIYTIIYGMYTSIDSIV